jgi:hypothetical protein
MYLKPVVTRNGGDPSGGGTSSPWVVCRSLHNSVWCLHRELAHTASNTVKMVYVTTRCPTPP